MSDTAPRIVRHAAPALGAMDASVETAAAVAIANITVKYDAAATTKFTYSGTGGSSGDVHMNPGTDTLRFSLDSGSTPGWRLKEVVFTAITQGATIPFSLTSAPNAAVLVYQDTNSQAGAQEFCYQVKVAKTVNGQETTDLSPDPKITNDPPATPPTP